MTTTLTRGILIAMTAGSLFTGACKKSDETKNAPAGAAPAPAEKVSKVHCTGVNACKGQGGCKSAANDCSGKNGCKGQGFIDTTEPECKAKGGTVMAAAN